MGKIKTNIGRYLLTVLETSIGCPWSTVGNKLYELRTLQLCGTDRTLLLRNVSVEVSDWGGKWDFKGASVSPDEPAKPLLSITDDEIKKLEIARISKDMYSAVIHLANPTDEVEKIELAWEKRANRGTNFHSAIAVAFRGITEPSLNSSIYSITAYDSQFVKIPFTIGITENSGKNGERRYADYSDFKKLVFVGNGPRNALILTSEGGKMDDIVLILDEADLEITVGDNGLAFFALKAKGENAFKDIIHGSCHGKCESCARKDDCFTPISAQKPVWKMFVFTVRFH